MRMVTHWDVAAAAIALRDLPPAGRRRASLSCLARAHAAARFRKRHRRAHWHWGNGTLSAAILADFPPRKEPFLSDRLYIIALADVFDVIIEWRSARQRS